MYFHNRNLQVAGVGGVQPIGKIGGSGNKLQAAVWALKEVFESEKSFLNSVNPKSRSLIQRNFGDQLVTIFAV